MKGIELLSSLIALLFLIGIGTFLGGIVILVINMVTLPSTNPIDYELQLAPSYPPVKYQTMLLSYLETTDESGFQIKKILAYAAYQGNVTNVFIDGTEVTTLGSSTSDMFNEWIPREFYVLGLNINGKEHIISRNTGSSSGSMLNLREISVPIYVDSTIYTVYSREGNPELPLNVTLDLYVQ
jgi:hypothetical protein